MNILSIKIKKEYFTSAVVIFRSINNAMKLKFNLQDIFISEIIVEKIKQTGINNTKSIFQYIYDRYHMLHANYLYIEDIELLPIIAEARHIFNWFNINIFIICHSILLDSWRKKWIDFSKRLTEYDFIWITSKYSKFLMKSINFKYDKFPVIPLMLDDELKKYNKNVIDKDDYCIYTGRIIPEKGITYLVKAWSKIKDIKKKLYLIGNCEKEYKEELYSYIQSENIIFKGVLYGKEKVDMIQNARFAIYPSFALSETFGVSIIEALYLGTPVICSDWSDFKEIISDGVNGFIVPGKDETFIEYLALTIRKIYTIDVKTISNNARIFGKSYLPETVMLSLERALEEIVKII